MGKVFVLPACDGYTVFVVEPIASLFQREGSILLPFAKLWRRFSPFSTFFYTEYKTLRENKVFTFIPGFQTRGFPVHVDKKKDSRKTVSFGARGGT